MLLFLLGLWQYMAATSPTQRDQHLLTIESEDRFVWKWMSGYYAQSHAEYLPFNQFW